MWRMVDACCITCHAPLIHAAAGIFYCPYERAGMDARARSIIVQLPLRDRDREDPQIPPLRTSRIALTRLTG